MTSTRQNIGLRLLDDLVAEGMLHFDFDDAIDRTGRSRTATANLLARLLRDGLIERVRRGKYAIRPLGVLGTSAASEDVLFAVSAGFSRTSHRVAYRSALEELDLLTHPSRSIQVAAVKSTRSVSLSGRPLRVVVEPEETISIGATKRGATYVSDVERALLDAAARPELIGGAAVLAEAIVAAAGQVNTARLLDYAERLNLGAGLRRIGSIADSLDVAGLARKLHPLAKPTSDIDLEPGAGESVWRDARWWVRWARTHAELANVARQ